ncbi:unnamed protein product [Adineta steineri]|uniref:Uncharacterized protein n=1 Tax=Adineta steineri TaxID=433720 RepID=A0A819DEX9_9BILA|nr:unnamed protein product [Adineta steineri]
MSLTNGQYNQPNSRRRYTLQPSIHRQQLNPNNSISYPSNSYNNKYEIRSSVDEQIDDPWVKELLQRDIDFSKLDHRSPSIQILNIKNNSKPIPQHFSSNQNNFNNRIKTSSSQNHFRTKENFIPSNQYRLSESNHHPSRKWIIEQLPKSNDFSLHNNQRNSRQYHLGKPNIDEEESLIQQQRKNSVHYKQSQHINTNDEEENNDNQSGIKNIWNLFSGKEKRNMFIYILGIMLYKFGLEAFNGSIVSLATNRYDRDAFHAGISARTFEKVGLLVGVNQAFQCIGSILIAPLIKHWPTRTVLSISIFIFSLLTALLMIIDASTGGKIKPTNFYPMYEHDYSYYGSYPTNIIIPIYCLTGIAYGMVELIRRIIPRDIVGTDEEKLQRMDALVHVFYEIAGVSGAFLTGLVLIPRLGNNYAFIITPILFTLSSIVWFFINSYGTKTNISNDDIPGGNNNEKTNYFKALIKGFILFGESVYIGGKIIFSNRKYIWLFPCYSLTLYVHRYIENGIAPQIAKRYLNNSEWSQIIVGGSNFGELLGALSVFFLTKKIRSPIVWLRLDCLLLLIVWYIPFYNPSSVSIKHAWLIALSFLPFGFGSAGDDVSLSAHIQSALSKPELKNKDVSSLGAVMAFLYSSYIILYAILNPLLGKYIDSVYNTHQTIRPAFIYTVGMQISIISFLVFISTFIPRNSFKLNPSLE